MCNTSFLRSFAIFSRFLYTQVLQAHILFCKTADNTVRRDDFATKFTYLVAKLRLGFYINFEHCFFFPEIEVHVRKDRFSD